MPPPRRPDPIDPLRFLAMLFGEGRGKALEGGLNQRQFDRLQSGHAPGGFRDGRFAGMGSDFYRMLADHLRQLPMAAPRPGGNPHFTGGPAGGAEGGPQYGFRGFPGLFAGNPGQHRAIGIGHNPHFGGAMPPPPLPGSRPMPDFQQHGILGAPGQLRKGLPIRQMHKVPGPPVPPWQRILAARAMQG